jgi:hypothetical protein
MESAQCSPNALFTGPRFRVEIHDHAEYQDDQPEQRAEHDQYAHARIPSPKITLSLTVAPHSNNRRSRSSFRDKLANLLAGNVEENRQRSRRSEYLPADMGIIGIRVETEVVEAIEQQVHRDPHFHASQVHSEADVCAVAP